MHPYTRANVPEQTTLLNHRRDEEERPARDPTYALSKRHFDMLDDDVFPALLLSPTFRFFSLWHGEFPQLALDSILFASMFSCALSLHNERSYRFGGARLNGTDWKRMDRTGRPVSIQATFFPPGEFAR